MAIVLMAMIGENSLEVTTGERQEPVILAGRVPPTLSSHLG